MKKQIYIDQCWRYINRNMITPEDMEGGCMMGRMMTEEESREVSKLIALHKLIAPFKKFRFKKTKKVRKESSANCYL